MINEAVTGWEAFEVALATRKASPPKAGDSYCFNLGDRNLFWFWTLISQHPDDSELWFLVPEDGLATALVGIYDINVPETEVCGQLVMRANFGVWAKLKDIEAKGSRSSFISDEYVNRTREVLACLARGVSPKDISSDQEECEYNPDYEDLADKIGCARAILDKMLNG